MYYSDFHVHSTYTRHPSRYYATMAQQAQRAVELGLNAICITEHMEPGHPNAIKQNYDPVLPMAAYQKEYWEVKEAFCRDLDLRFGIEVGLIEPHVEEITGYLQGYPLDCILVSIHHIVNDHTPDYGMPHTWTEETRKEDAIEASLSALMDLGGQLGDFDIAAHLTVFARKPKMEDREIRYEHAPDAFDTALRWLIQTGRGIEINAGDIPRLGFFHPGITILTRYRELGGEILTLGSDAHGTETLGSGIRDAAALAEAAGFRYHTTFQQRMPIFHRI